MKILVATAQSQGHRTNDFHFCIDGELVILSFPCDRDTNDPDGRCGCSRSFAGLNSHRATTTALVTALPDFTADDYLEAIHGFLEATGFDADLAEDIAREHLRLAQQFPVGAVLERRLDDIIWRQRK